MKKNIIAVMFILTAVLISCQKKADAGAGKDAAPQKVELKIGSQDNPGTATFIGLEVMQNKLEELSDGMISLEIFPSSQLGDYKAMAGQVTAGELDMLTTGYPDLSFMIPAFEVFGESYVVTSYEQMQKVSQGVFAQKLYRELEAKNIHFLDLWYTGARHVTSNRPLNSIDDFAGLKLRTPNVPFLIRFAESTGALPSPIAFQEVYLALQTNQVEAQENPLTTINVMKFYEVQKYIAMTSHAIATKGLWINTKVWDKLDVKQRSIVMKAIEAGRKANDDKAKLDESSLLEKFQADGIQVTYPDLEPFKKAMKPYYQDLDEKYASYGANLVESLQSIE